MGAKYYWAEITFPDEKWTAQFDWRPLYDFLMLKLAETKMPPKEAHLQFDRNTAAQIFLGPFASIAPARFVFAKVNEQSYVTAKARVRVKISSEVCPPVIVCSVCGASQ